MVSVTSTSNRTNKLLPGWDKIQISEECLAKLPVNGVPIDLPSMADPKVAEDDVFEGPNYNETHSEDENCQNECDVEDLDFESKEPHVIQDVFAPCMVPIPQVQKKEKQKIMEMLQWPSREANPVDELHTIQLASKCFPTPFPNGTGDPTNT